VKLVLKQIWTKDVEWIRLNRIEASGAFMNMVIDIYFP
jgi:hypothetical protein